MRAVADLHATIQVLVDRNAALGEADAQRGGLDLEEGVVKADGIIR